MTSDATPRLTRRAALAGAGALAVGIGLPAAQAEEKVLTIGSAFSPLSMDPALSGNGRAGIHLMPAYEPLLRTKADGSFEPALATEWSLTDDSKSATFKLRQDARFSDGAPVNAAAVKSSIEYFVNKKGPFSANLATLASIDVVDEFTVRINLSKPQPNLHLAVRRLFPLLRYHQPGRADDA